MAIKAGQLESFSTFGAFLRHLRIRAQLSQLELSIAVGYSEAQISRLESNKRPPNNEVIRALFVPALHLEDEPEIVARLMVLANGSKTGDGRGESGQGQEVRALPVREQHNLPAELTSLVGREMELAEVARLLDEPATRLLTLTGSGGCGKTRLALRSGRNLAGSFPHGAWLVELAPLSDPALVPQALIDALGLVITPGRQPVDVLTGYLKERRQLLILDNCEHLIDAVARLVVDLLRACPDLKILATSREPLDVPGEVTYRVPSLALPPANWDASPEVSAAGQLFLERARSIQPGFTLAEQDGPALSRICRRLDGIPLAIELAAARVSALPVSLIAARLEEGFRVLGPGSRGAVPRQATLRATVEWSYNLLSKPERILLRRLPFFAGGWTLEQAEEVCGCGGIEREEVLDLLSSLVSKSLINAEHKLDGSMRYRLHEIVRQYAHERLAESGEEDGVRRCFVDCLVRLAETAEPEIKSFRQATWRARLTEEDENLTEALNLAVTHQDVLAALRLSGALVYYWIQISRWVEGSRWLDACLALPGAEGASILPARAKAMVGRLWITPSAGRSTTPEMDKECEQACLSLGDEHMLAFVQTISFNSADPAAWSARLLASLPGLLSAGEHWIAAHVLFRLQSWERRSQGNFAAGRAYLEEANTHARASGDRYLLSLLISFGTWLEWDSGDVCKAHALAEEALRLETDAGVSLIKIEILFYISYFCAALGDFHAAYENLRESIHISDSIGAAGITKSLRLASMIRLYCLDGRFSDAKEEYDQGLSLAGDIAKEAHDHSIALQYLGLALLYENHLEQAVQALEESLALAEEVANHVMLHGPLRSLGTARLAQGDLPAARDLLHRSLAEITRNRTLPDFPESLDPLAGLVLQEGQPIRAARLLGASDGLIERMELQRYPAFRPQYERWCAEARSALGEADFTSAYAAGFSLAALADPIGPIVAIVEG